MGRLFADPGPRPGSQKARKPTSTPGTTLWGFRDGLTGWPGDDDEPARPRPPPCDRSSRRRGPGRMPETAASRYRGCTEPVLAGVCVGTESNESRPCPPAGTVGPAAHAGMPATGLAQEDVAAVLAALRERIGRELGKEVPGQFAIPGLVKLRVVRKPATKARQGVTRSPAAPMTFQARPAQRGPGPAAEGAEGIGLTRGDKGPPALPLQPGRCPLHRVEAPKPPRSSAPSPPASARTPGDPATRGGAILLANALAEALAASGAPHPEDPAEIPRILEQ